jgi:hypothetical protein
MKHKLLKYKDSVNITFFCSVNSLDSSTGDFFIVDFQPWEKYFEIVPCVKIFALFVGRKGL